MEWSLRMRASTAAPKLIVIVVLKLPRALLDAWRRRSPRRAGLEVERVREGADRLRAESTTKRSRVVFASHHRSRDSYIAVRLGTLYVVTRSAIPESGIGNGGSMAFMPQTARLAPVSAARCAAGDKDAVNATTCLLEASRARAR